MFKISVWILLLSCSTLLWGQEFDHSRWDELLKKHVEELPGAHASRVDYDGMLQNRQQLGAYLESLSTISQAQFDDWPQQQQLAFLINAYNAGTVQLIVMAYPSIDSIKDLGSLFRSPWKKRFILLFDNLVSLDDIEHSMIRGWDRYREPRIHFAVNCAAIGCPALRAQAYTGEDLEDQLETSVELFLSDRTRNYIQANRLYISRIFDWYEEDFERGWGGVESVAEFLSGYVESLGLSEVARQDLLRGQLPLRYLKYDWGLNDLKRD